MRIFIFALGLGLGISPASTDKISFRITNSATKAVSGLTATPSVDNAETPIPMETGVGPGDTGEITFAAPGQQCIFDLAINVASGEDILRPDVDLCQLEVLVIE